MYSNSNSRDRFQKDSVRSKGGTMSKAVNGGAFTHVESQLSRTRSAHCFTKGRTAKATAVTWQDVLSLWSEENDEFYQIFTDALCNSYADFFWECEPVTAETLHNPFQFVLIDASGRLAGARASADDFREHLRNAKRPAVTFPNLGGDAMLVVPTQVESFSRNMYGNLAFFVRGAPKEQQQHLWKLVAAELQKSLSAGPRTAPVWLSTDGTGVPWLHVRLESKPKYIKHADYRAVPSPAVGPDHEQDRGSQFIKGGGPPITQGWRKSTKIKTLMAAIMLLVVIVILVTSICVGGGSCTSRGGSENVPQDEDDSLDIDDAGDAAFPDADFPDAAFPDADFPDADFPDADFPDTVPAEAGSPLDDDTDADAPEGSQGPTTVDGPSTNCTPPIGCPPDPDSEGEPKDSSTGDENTDGDVGGDPFEPNTGGETPDGDVGGGPVEPNTGGETPDGDVGGGPVDPNTGGENADGNMGGEPNTVNQEPPPGGEVPQTGDPATDIQGDQSLPDGSGTDQG